MEKDEKKIKIKSDDKVYDAEDEQEEELTKTSQLTRSLMVQLNKRRDHQSLGS